MPVYNFETRFHSFVSNFKIRFVVIGSVLWLTALGSWIYLCPKYSPDAEYLLYINFASMPARTHRTSELVIEPWHRFSKGVVWDAENGFSGSACVKLAANGKESSYLEWILTNPRRYAFLEFRGKMRSDSIVRGENEWDSARFLVYFRDKHGKGHWDYPHVAGSLLGTSSWREFVEIFPVPDFAVTAHVVIQNSGKSGTIWCDDVALRPAHLNCAYFLYKRMLSFAGACLALVFIIISDLWKPGGRITLILLVTILSGALWSNSYLETLAGNYHVNADLIKKFGHLALFLLLGLVATRWFATRLRASGRSALFLPYPILIFGGLLLFAVMTEFAQFLSIGRHPSIRDVLIDTIGIVTGISVGWYLRSKTENEA